MNKNINEQNNETRMIEISKIKVPDGRRPIGDLDGLIESIKQVGLLHAITVTPDLELVAGLHRMRACKALGWKEIPAKVQNFEGIDRQLAELHENLERNSLTVLERCEQLARLKKTFERLHPETKRGNTKERAKVKRKNCVSHPTFSVFVGEKLRMSKRSIEQEVRIGKMRKAWRDDVRGTPVADVKTDLMKLTTCPEQKVMKVVATIRSGSAKSFARAEEIVRGARLKKKVSELTGQLIQILKRMNSDFTKYQQHGEFQKCFDECTAGEREEFLHLLEGIHSESESLIEYLQES
jgi:ParB family chromosome partitioning protein